MRERSALEVFLAFLKLGLMSFGGPIAHLGYFRDEIVVRRRWVDEATYSDLVALCQFLPGPASSQIGFSLGLIRARYWGALAAWLGFTLPSALLMTAFAFGAGELSGPVGLGVLHGLKLVAVSIVAQAVWGMASTLCADRPRALIACVAALVALVSRSFMAQISVILMGALAGLWLCRAATPTPARRLQIPLSRRSGALALGAFFILLAGLPILASASQTIDFFSAFYRSGALVFGGGHVVLPILSEALVKTGWVSQASFLAGYGAAQALPGPLFAFAAYLGVVGKPAPHGLAGAALGIVGIFLPGILVLLGTLPYWDSLRQRAEAQAAMRGINAAVVGLLGAALYSPLWINSVGTLGDFALALLGFVLLTVWRAPSFLIVIMGALGGVALTA